MHRRFFAVATLALSLFAAGVGVAQADMLGPGPWFGRVWPWGNDTGGIIPYSPAFRVAAYREMAADYCARWGRLSQLTSVHRRYGDYVGFVCMDRPGHIH